MKQKILFPLLYLFILLLCFEGGIRIILSIPKVKWRILTAQDSLYWRESWFERRSRIQELEGFYPFDRYDATKGWISKPNLRNFKAFRSKILNTNNSGFRGVRDYTLDKLPGKVRIMFIGDSFTFGDEVSDDETYTHYLQQMLPDAEIMNFGVHGYGHDQMLILLKEEGIRYRPDLVVLGFIHMDCDRNTVVFRDFAKPRFELSDGALRLTNSPVPTPESLIKWDFMRLGMLDYGYLAYTRMKYRYFSSRRDEVTAITAAILREMETVIRAAGARPIFVFLPTGLEMANRRNGRAHERYFFNLCRSVGDVECTSLLPLFQEKVREGVKFKRQGHWLSREHRIVAEGLRDHLVKQGYVTGK